MKKIMTILLILAITGCSTLPKDRRTYTKDDWQIVARDNKVDVQVFEQLTSDNEYFYDVRLVNKSKDVRCVAMEWRLVDLQDFTAPSPYVIPGKSTANVGHFKQDPWTFGKLKVTPQPTGYVTSLIVVKVDKDNVCEF